MLPRLPCSRSGAWHTVTHPGHGGAGCKRFVPVHQRPRPASAGGGEDASTLAGSLRHGERLQSGLTQRDMWVMHSPAGAGGGGGG
jgi:hypothetical protein